MKQRVLTALALMPVVLAVIFVDSSWPLICLAAIVVFVAGGELGAFAGERSWAIPAAATLLFLLIAVETALLPQTFLLKAIALSALTIIGLGAAYSGKQWAAFPAALWVVGPMAALVLLHQSSDQGKWPILLAILPLWGGDTAAIFAGKAFGKHPMAPAISPKKTWEGGVANLLACILVAMGCAALTGQPPWRGIGAGAIAGVFGQAGDLFESYLKRRSGIKDSGSILPGHGGLMDRVDSLLFTAPLVALWLGLSG